MRLSPLPFLTLSLLAAAVSVATAQTQGHELDRPTTVEPHPVLTPGAPLLHRHLTPEQYRRWQTHPPLINLLQNEVRPILNATSEAVNTLRGTAEFLGENVVEPVIKLNGYLAGLKRMLELMGIKPK